jgi:DNA-binding transcriptional LysR family regulator
MHMKIESSRLEAFYAVARLRSFTNAARSLHITQSALSQRISKLESFLETVLLIRDRAGLRLTEAGQKLLKYCQLQENFENELLGGLQSSQPGQLSGSVRIAAFSSVMRSVIMPALSPLSLEHPKVHMEFQTKEVYELLPALKRGEVDFIVADKQIEREELESYVLGHEKYVLVEAKSYKGPEVFLDHDEKDETTRRYLKLVRKSNKPPKRHYMDDIYGIMEGARLGMGKAILPKHLVSEIKDLRIKKSQIVLELPVVLHFYRQSVYPRLQSAVVQRLKTSSRHFLES